MDGHTTPTSSFPYSITYPLSTPDDYSSYKFVDQIMMDDPDDSNNHHDPPWGVVDSWINDSPQLCHGDDDDDDHHHNNVIGGNCHDDQYHDLITQYKVGSVVGTNGGDEGKSRSDHGRENGCGIEDQCPDDQEDQLPLQVVWPSALVPGSCSSCQVLREIVHTNDTHTTKLEIHGKVGVISHGIYSSNDGLAASEFRKSFMLDFSKQNAVDIKEYLKDYLEEHRENGYSLFQDPLSLFYEALCSGYDWLNFQGTNSGGPFAREETSNQAMNPLTIVPQRANQQVPTMMKTELAIQRERVKKMKLEDVAKYFEMRMSDASEELHLCASVLKKKLRSYNISRWPYRKVESIKRKISDLEAKKCAKVGNHWVEKEIQKLRQKLLGILSGKLKP